MLTAMFRSLSYSAANTKSRRDVSSTLRSQAPTNQHWSTWAAEPETVKASAIWNRSNHSQKGEGATPWLWFLVTVTRMENETHRNKDKICALDLPHEAGRSLAADPYSGVWGGWVFSTSAAPSHTPLTSESAKPIPLSLHSHPPLINWNSWLTWIWTWMPHCCPGLRHIHLEWGTVTSQVAPTICPVNIKKSFTPA